MKLSKAFKRILVIILSVIAFLVIAVVATNLIIANIIENKIKKSITDEYKGRYEVSFGNVNVNIISGNVTLKDFKIIPDSAFLARYINGKSILSNVMEIEVPRFRLIGLKINEAITKSNIDISELQIIEATVKFYIGMKPVAIDSIPVDTVKINEKKFNLDSIQLAGLNGVSIGKIELINCNFDLTNVKNAEAHINASEIDISFNGIRLDKLPGDSSYFKFVLDEMKFNLTNEIVSLPGELYFLSFGKLAYDKTTSSLVIEDMKLYPQSEDLFEMAKKLVYTTEVFTVSVKEFGVYNFDIRRLINEKKLYGDSISITEMDLDILKDKRFPWNYAKRPQLPNHVLRMLEFPMYIGQMNVHNSRLYYHEIMEDVNEQMSVILANWNVQVNFITSMKDSTSSGKPMTINMKCQLMEVADLEADFTMPLNNLSDAFTFTGSLGKAKLNSFNTALRPATGIMITEGNLEKLTFSAKANNFVSTGQMTMIYSDLTAEVLKKNEEDKGKFMSFLANAVVHTSNPGKNGRLRIAEMGFERVQYKGFGNFVWKTLQTGIVNSLLPTGKSEKQEKEISKEQEKQSKKEAKAEKRKK